MPPRASAWYEERKSGLGGEFLKGLDHCLETILQHPLAYAGVRYDARRALLKRFPYGTFYVIDEAEILILACLHAKRRPEILRSRP